MIVIYTHTKNRYHCWSRKRLSQSGAITTGVDWRHDTGRVSYSSDDGSGLVHSHKKVSSYYLTHLKREQNVAMNL